MVYFTQVFLPECVGKPLDFNFEVQTRARLHEVAPSGDLNPWRLRGWCSA